MPTLSPETAALLETVAERARQAGVFASVAVADGVLSCEASGSAEKAFYRVVPEEETLWVALVMADRWQSESIEADLMHTGDKLGELIEEELVDLGYDQEGPVPFEHYRSDDMLFTFRSKLPVSADAAGADEAVFQWLRAYEACFANLGDMTAGEDDD